MHATIIEQLTNNKITEPEGHPPSHPPMTKLAANQQVTLFGDEDLKLVTKLVKELGDTSLSEADAESGRVSVITLSAVLGLIYGLAFILAVVWVVMVWARKRNEKRRQRRRTRPRSRNESLSVCSD